MNILCIANRIFVPGAGERKEDTHFALSRIHANITPDTYVLAGNTKSLDQAVIPKIEESMGGAHVVIVSNTINLFTVLSYAVQAFSFDMPQWWRFLKVIRGYRRELTAIDKHIENIRKPDVINAVHSVECSGILAYLIGKKYNIPYIIIERRTHYQRGHMIGARGRRSHTVITNADLVLPISPQHNQSIKQALDINGENMRTLSVSIGNHLFKAPTNAPDWMEEFTKDAFTFAGWTNWRDIKRLDIALEAFATVYKKRPEARFIVAGPTLDWAEAKASELGIESAVYFAGNLNREEIWALLYACDCCVISSDHETLSVPSMEAMAAGKPVVSTRCGGPESIITSEKYGKLVETDNMPAFAEAMLHVIENPTEFDSEVIASYCYENYSEAAMLNSWREIYEPYNN